MTGESLRSCTATGVVTAATAGRLEIELASPARCHGCNGACRWYGDVGTRRVIVETERVFPVGAAVTLQVADGALLRGAAMVFGLPLAGLLGGALAGFEAWGSDLGTAAGAGTAVICVLGAMWALRGRLEQQARQTLAVLPAI